MRLKCGDGEYMTQNNLIAAAFANRRAALISFLTAGFPRRDSTVPMLQAMVAAGVDVLEVGVPFSDPMADGAAIQRAGLRALENGMTLKKTISQLAVFRRDNQKTPLVLMGYANSFLQYGLEKFANDAADAGINGAIVVDIADSDRRRWRDIFAAHSLDLISLVAPTTTPTRLRQLAAEARGFLYFISLKGITGAANIDIAEVSRQMTAIRAAAKTPVAIGFGIREAGQAAALAKVADGVVIGSRLVEIVEACEEEGAVVSAGGGISSDGLSTQRDLSLKNNSSFLRGRESVDLLGGESATPQNSRGEFYPPPQAAEGERIVAGGENLGDSRLRGNDEVGGGNSERDNLDGDSADDDSAVTEKAAAAVGEFLRTVARAMKE